MTVRAKGCETSKRKLPIAKLVVWSHSSCLELLMKSTLATVVNAIQCRKCLCIDNDEQKWWMVITHWRVGGLKGKLGDFFLFVQSFYRPKTMTSFNRQFSPKSPKIGQKSGQRVRNSPNKDQVASDLLWESINSGVRPTVGIHQFWRPSYCGNPLEYINGFPQ